MKTFLPFVPSGPITFELLNRTSVKLAPYGPKMQLSLFVFLKDRVVLVRDIGRYTKIERNTKNIHLICTPEARNWFITTTDFHS